MLNAMFAIICFFAIVWLFRMIMESEQREVTPENYWDLKQEIKNAENIKS